MFTLADITDPTVSKGSFLINPYQIRKKFRVSLLAMADFLGVSPRILRLLEEGKRPWEPRFLIRYFCALGALSYRKGESE